MQTTTQAATEATAARITRSGRLHGSTRCHACGHTTKEATALRDAAYPGLTRVPVLIRLSPVTNRPMCDECWCYGDAAVTREDAARARAERRHAEHATPGTRKWGESWAVCGHPCCRMAQRRDACRRGAA